MTSSEYLEQIKPISNLDSFILSFLKTYFKFHPEFPYTDDGETKISIISSFDLEAGNSDVTPKIVLQSGPFNLMNPGFMNNERGGGLLKDLTQSSSIINRVGCVYFLKIITRTMGQARSLTEELMVVFSTYVERLKRMYNINLEKVFDAEPETPEFDGNIIKSASTRLKLVCSYIYTTNVKVTPIYPKLKDVDFYKELDTALAKNNEIELNKLKFNMPAE